MQAFPITSKTSIQGIEKLGNSINADKLPGHLLNLSFNRNQFVSDNSNAMGFQPIIVFEFLIV
jgi:hypothetical protein